MGDHLHILKREEVVDLDTFNDYVCQHLGVPPISYKKKGALKKYANEIFKNYPRADFQTFVRTADFVKNRGWRMEDSLAVLGCYKKAYKAGFLPELDPQTYHDPELEEKLKDVLQMEDHPRWVERLNSALYFYSDDQRREVYEAWKSDRTKAGMPVV